MEQPRNFMQGHLRYKTGDATVPVSAGHRIIIHICNDVGKWGKGFVLSLSKRWKKPEEEYRRWYRSQNRFLLGEIQEVNVQSDTTIINMIAQHDIKSDKDGKPPIRYDALETCLEKVAKIAKYNGSSVHGPKFGCGLGGCKDWSIIENIIKKTLISKGINVTIYDLPE